MCGVVSTYLGECRVGIVNSSGIMKTAKETSHRRRLKHGIQSKHYSSIDCCGSKKCKFFQSLRKIFKYTYRIWWLSLPRCLSSTFSLSRLKGFTCARNVTTYFVPACCPAINHPTMHINVLRQFVICNNKYVSRILIQAARPALEYYSQFCHYSIFYRKEIIGMWYFNHEYGNDLVLKLVRAC